MITITIIMMIRMIIDDEYMKMKMKVSDDNLYKFIRHALKTINIHRRLCRIPCGKYWSTTCVVWVVLMQVPTASYLTSFLCLSCGEWMNAGITVWMLIRCHPLSHIAEALSSVLVREKSRKHTLTVLQESLKRHLRIRRTFFLLTQSCQFAKRKEKNEEKDGGYDGEAIDVGRKCGTKAMALRQEKEEGGARPRRSLQTECPFPVSPRNARCCATKALQPWHALPASRPCGGAVEF